MLQGKDQPDNSGYLDYDFLKNGDNGETRLQFSLISGYNFYKIPANISGRTTYTGIHIPSGTAVRITNITESDHPVEKEAIRRHQKFMLKPMPQEYFEWPIDLVEICNEAGKYIQSYVFPQKAYPAFTPIKQLLYQEKTSTVLDWRNGMVRDICISILKTFSMLHANGYSYNDFNINRIFYDQKTKNIFLRYTLEMRMDEDMERPIIPKKIAMEFAPPYIYKKEEFTGNIDDFSISSLLFRLMIGRLPYEGKGLASFGDVFDPIRDTDSEAHKYYFQHYHEFPHFIFDPDDDSNTLGPMSENDLPKKRWELLTERIKIMFQNTFIDAGTENMKLFSCDEWLKELGRHCWKYTKDKRGLD